MFEQSFVEATGKTNKSWTVMVSLGLQICLILAGIIIPLLNVFDAGHRIIKPETKEKSIFYNPLSQLIPAVLPYLKNQIDSNKDENETPAIV